MNINSINDTITAIATPLGTGGVGVIRISGEDSIKIVNKVFDKKDLIKTEGNTIHFGRIVYKQNEIAYQNQYTQRKGYTKHQIKPANAAITGQVSFR